ncbi:hypothetical protein [Dehalococcoides mccartyi]|uniref:hypothetical protein n=1 Tax=Dehalococcoides mccartyi TaxID=61435 RepID=UPI0007503B09|nr:hypothetical protein [Dehalococcoides mccartyi]
MPERDETWFDFPCSNTFRGYEAEINYGPGMAEHMCPRTDYRQAEMETPRASELPSRLPPAGSNGLRNIQGELNQIKMQLAQQSNKLENHLEASRNYVRRDRL